MTPSEEWKPVVGLEGLYEVSDLGRVRSLPRRVPSGTGMRDVPPKILVTPISKTTGYPQITLMHRTRHVHSLVMEAFVGPRPEGAEVCHNDGIRANSVLTNLRYDSISENRIDTIRHGNNPRTNRTHCPQGHPYDETNTGRRQRARRCLACHRERERLRSQRRAAS